MTARDQRNRLKVNVAQIFAQERRLRLAHDILAATDHPAADRLLARLTPHLPDTTPQSTILKRWGRQAGTVFIGLLIGIGIGRMQVPADSIAADPRPQPVSATRQVEMPLLQPTLTIDPALDARRADVLATNQAAQRGITLTRTAQALSDRQAP